MFHLNRLDKSSKIRFTRETKTNTPRINYLNQSIASIFRAIVPLS